MKRFKYYLFSTLAVLITGITAVNGQVLFTDDFEAWTVGEPVTDVGSENDPQRWKSDGDPFDIIEQDTGNVFGLGTDNQFMRVGNVPVDGALPGGSLDIEQRSYDKGDGVPTGVLQVSFDFYEPSSGSGKGFVSDLSDPGYLRIRGDKTGAGLHIIILDDGELQVAGEGEEVVTLHTYGEDTVVRFDFVFNQSGEDVTYRDNVLNSGKVDIYANNVLVAANIETGTADALDEIERILLRTAYAEGGTIAQEMWIDNWQTAAVPPDPSGGVDETWAGYPVSETGDTNTGEWLGWINVSAEPWILSYSLNQWMYIDESAVSDSGSWAYVFNF
jgi:hypothetical protein